MEKFEGFTVGQEFVIVDAESMGVGDDYSDSDKMTITSVTSDGEAQCDKGYCYAPLWFERGYLKPIKDIPEEQPKLTPRDLKCFEEVAKVIGEEGAEKELQEVIDVEPDIVWFGEGFDKSLDEAFDWEESPQGYEFWCLIEDNKPPKGYAHESSIPTMKEAVEDLEGERGYPENIEYEPKGDSVEVRYVDVEEYTGSSVSYYTVKLENGNEVECNDIIEALGMNYAEGNAFKAIWRKCAAQSLGKSKKGYDNGLYDSEKVVYFGERMVIQEKRKLED